jgi:hypothetical protein
MYSESINLIPPSPVSPVAAAIRPRAVDAISVQDALTDTFDLSREGRNVLETFQSLSGEDRAAYLESLARLLKSGYVGLETLQVEQRPVTRVAEARMADPVTAGAPPYRR